MVQLEFILVTIGSVTILYRIVKHSLGLGAEPVDKEKFQQLPYAEKQNFFTYVANRLSQLDDAPDDHYLSEVLKIQLQEGNFAHSTRYSPDISEIVQNYRIADEAKIKKDKRVISALEQIFYESNQMLGNYTYQSLEQYFSSDDFFEGYKKTQSIVQEIFSRAVAKAKEDYISGNAEYLDRLVNKVLLFSKMLADETVRDRYLEQIMG